MLQQKFTTNLYNILGPNKTTKIAIAVSGGSDSITLLHLAYDWSRHYEVGITVFSVDHNLRAESKLELAYVQKISQELGLDFISLSWKPDSKKTAIQERAREARYNLITEHCIKLGISVLLTAHHLDDNLETYLIKKSKKASQLALKPNITYFWNNIWIVRPLFNIPKIELVDYLRKKNISWFEDASNLSDQYERNRVRKKLNALLPNEKYILFREYDRAINRAEELNDLLIKAFAETISIYNEGFAKVDILKFNLLDEEIKIHLLNYVLTIVGGKTTIPRYRNLVNIISAIANNDFKSSTLSQCSLRLKNGIMVVYREGVRRQYELCHPRVSEDLKNIKVDPHLRGDDTVVYGDESSCSDLLSWDNRFEVTINNANNYTISSLILADYIKIKNSLNLEKLAKDSNNNHKAILFTLPVIKNLEKVVAMPHISYYDGLLEKDIKVIFAPKFISRFTHFF